MTNEIQAKTYIDVHDLRMVVIWYLFDSHEIMIIRFTQPRSTQLCSAELKASIATLKETGILLHTDTNIMPVARGGVLWEHTAASMKRTFISADSASQKINGKLSRKFSSYRTNWEDLMVCSTIGEISKKDTVLDLCKCTRQLEKRMMEKRQMKRSRTGWDKEILEVSKSENAVKKVMEAFQSLINPFEVDDESKLNPLACGAAASDEVTQEVLNAEEIGKKAKERLEKNERFFEPIKRQKLK
ncbi:hypothetical protein GQR58_017096 [Nymphon striatum]|nr:hypothetical protein GQR58_017096 [Nymphon striatum]